MKKRKPLTTEVAEAEDSGEKLVNELSELHGLLGRHFPTAGATRDTSVPTRFRAPESLHDISSAYLFMISELERDRPCFFVEGDHRAGDVVIGVDV